MPRDLFHSSVPTTPTLSSVASSDISLEDVPPINDASSQASDDDGVHPTLFMNGDMISIKVDKMLFRIPTFYLTQDSVHFSRLLAKHDPTRILHIKDEDVSSSAFAHLLQVVRTPLGVVPLSTLSEWTDVLHLSSKWAFDHLRDAAIKAVVPLASPVDKLVLARTYGFLDWIPGAYADLLAREEDLDEDEAERMTIKDILAIAKGRRAAAKVGSRSQIEKIVHGLLPSEFVPVKQDSQTTAHRRHN